MKNFYVACLLFACVQVLVAPPMEKDEKQAKDDLYNIDGLSTKEAQEQEYFRYITQVVTELEKDPTFKEKMENVTEDDIKSGKVADMLDVVGHNVRKKVDEIKRMEVEYQRDLIRRNKHHMKDSGETYWNPVHHDNTETFEKEDFQKLLRRHKDMIEEVDKKRHEEFKKHELEKEHQRREAMKNMTTEEKAAEEKKHEESHHKEHEKIHEPGHKAQLEEVWDKSDGFDPENFDPKTFFNYHDKNNDGYLDYFEVETFFLHDLDKIYNEDDPNVDSWEREEELERMREHMLKTMDNDGDGMISREEFLMESKKEEFEKDEEWKPLTEDDQFTESEYAQYEQMLEDVRKDKEREAAHEEQDGDKDIKKEAQS